MYWITGILGIFLMLAPYLLGYTWHGTAFLTSLIVGAIITIASIWEGVESHKRTWEYWVATIVGISAIVAPFALGFGTLNAAMWTSVLCGILVAIFAGSKLWTTSTS